MRPRPHAEVVCDVLKAVRNERRSFREILEAVDISKNTLRRRLNELVANGLVERGFGREGATWRGCGPILYWLSPEWGGRA